MASYEVYLRPPAQKQLDSISGNNFSSIVSALLDLGRDPRPLKTRKMAESGLWRVRVGRYRIIYRIEDEARTVTVLRIVKRDENTYKRLQ
jgi:mRNA interferase RelE/StbE